MRKRKRSDSLDSTDAESMVTDSTDTDSMMDCSNDLDDFSQSKLTQQELSDLQKATHFDKKELQQWYKGTLLRLPRSSSSSCS